MAENLPKAVIHITTEEDEPRYGPNIAFLTSEKAVVKTDVIPTEDDRPRRGRPPKNKSSVNSHVEVDESRDLPFYQTNTPYVSTYEETNMMLRGAIAEVDGLNTIVQTELASIAKSKTLKRKYEYISELSSTSSSLLGTKISAIREMNKSITDSHNLDMKRVKELKLEANVEDDDKRMMDMYNAFVNTPVPSGISALGPGVAELSAAGAMNIMPTDIGGDIGDIGYAQYVNNLTPEQNRMRMEVNPNIETVVVYNQETGERWFDVIDRATGQSVPNMPKPPEFLLDKMRPDIANGCARNSDTDMNFKLVTVGRSIMNEY